MTMIPKADALIEQLYDTVFKACPSEDREAVARIALLAAQHRAQQLHQQRMLKAQTGRRARAHSQARDCLSLDPEPGQSEGKTQ